MSTFVETAPASPAVHIPSPASSVATPAAPAAPQSPGITTPARSKVPRKESLLLSIFTASACLHLLVIGLTGYGSPKPAARHVMHHDAPPPPVIENVHIEDAPPPPPQQQPKELTDEAPRSDALAAPAPVAAVDAVAANVAVNFGIKVTGPVNLVSTTAETTNAVSAPVIVPQEATGRNLLTPEVTYPPVAKYKHLTGQVVVEFRTTTTGDISDVKVRQSSGHAELDQAAVNNLRLGHWVGEAGYFTKTYEFVLR